MDHSDVVCSEDECPLCSGIAPILRGSFRSDLFTVPLNRPICVECLLAFWRNVIESSEPEEPEPQPPH